MSAACSQPAAPPPQVTGGGKSVDQATAGSIAGSLLVAALGAQSAVRRAVAVPPAEAMRPPAPAVYRLAAERLGRPLGGVRLVSSNPFDVLGAANVGMPAAWVNRSGGPFDTLGPPPDLVVGTLLELADALERPPG